MFRREEGFPHSLFAMARIILGALLVIGVFLLMIDFKANIDAYIKTVIIFTINEILILKFGADF